MRALRARPVRSKIELSGDVLGEVLALRRAEAHYDRAACELDRLQRAVMAVDARIVVIPALRGEAWVPLPRGWRAVPHLQLFWRVGPIPQEIKGEIAVSFQLAMRLVGQVRS